MKKSKKIVKNLEKRIKEFAGINRKAEGMTFHQPGSLNQKRS